MAHERACASAQHNGIGEIKPLFFTSQFFTEKHNFPYSHLPSPPQRASGRCKLLGFSSPERPAPLISEAQKGAGRGQALFVTGADNAPACLENELNSVRTSPTLCSTSSAVVVTPALNARSTMVMRRKRGVCCKEDRKKWTIRGVVEGNVAQVRPRS